MKNGATQVVILGAGLDSRAYRFRELLKYCRVIEVDPAPTQEYKRRRVEEVLREIPSNVTYCTVDFAEDNLIDGLLQAGLVEDEKTFNIWEGVCMYLPEDSVRKTLQMVASHSALGSSLVLDYANSPWKASTQGRHWIDDFFWTAPALAPGLIAGKENRRERKSPCTTRLRAAGDARLRHGGCGHSSDRWWRGAERCGRFHA